MPLIRTAINYRNYTLGPGPGETIAVFTVDGHYRHVRFNGFIDREEAVRLKSDGAKPVKLYAKAFAVNDDLTGKWIDVPNQHAIQGCWYRDSVWAVTVNGIPKIVTKKIYPEK